MVGCLLFGEESSITGIYTSCYAYTYTEQIPPEKITRYVTITYRVNLKTLRRVAVLVRLKEQRYQ
jgi:hypothetical protein